MTNYGDILYGFRPKMVSFFMTAFLYGDIALNRCKHWLFAKMNGDMVTYADTEKLGFCSRIIFILYYIIFNRKSVSICVTCNDTMSPCHHMDLGSRCHHNYGKPEHIVGAILARLCLYTQSNFIK